MINTRKMMKRICRVWSKRVSKHKAIEIQTDITTPHFAFAHEFHIYSDSINLYLDALGIVGFHIKLSRKCDHAGMYLSTTLFGLCFTFELYDVRHWDNENDCPMSID